MRGTGRGRPARRRQRVGPFRAVALGRGEIGDDTGSTLPLVAAFAGLAVTLVLVGMAATSLYLERKRLYSLADAAALVGAESFALDDVSAVTSPGQGEVRVAVTLRPARVRDAVESFVAIEPTGRLEGLAVVEATSTDGRSATVTLASSWRPPLVTLVLPEGVRLEVTSVARSVLR